MLIPSAISVLMPLSFTFCVISVLEGIVVYTWQFRAERGARWHIRLQANKSLWLVMLVTASLGEGRLLGAPSGMACSLCAFAAVYFWYRFISELSGYDREAPRWLRPGIEIGLLFCGLLVVSNPWHHLVWIQAHESGMLRQHPGRLFGFTVLFAYGVNLFSAGLNVRWALRCHGLRRRQAWAFLVPSLISWTGQFMAYMPWASVYDPHAVFFLLSGLTTAWAFFRWRSYSVLPLAQEAMLRSMIDALMVVDEEGYIVRLNTAACSIFPAMADEGVRFDAIANVCPVLLPLREAQDPRVLEANWEIAGSKRFFQVQTTPLYTSARHLLGQVFCFKDITLEKAQQTCIVEQEKAISLLEERARLGRELHDGQGQLWSYLSMQLFTMRGKMEQGDSGRALELMTQLQKVVQETHVGVRETITGLQTGSTLLHGLLPALEEQLRWYREHCGWQARLELHCPWQEKLLSPHTEAQLMRIVQEALANVRKSAQADCVLITIDRIEDALTFCVEDNGCGFDPEKVREQSGHHGLSMMRERAHEAGAELRIESKVGAGTRIVLTVPVPSNGIMAEDVLLQRGTQ